MRVLVMGGSRFMGLAVVQQLLKRGHEVATFNRGTRPVRWPAPVRELRGDRDDRDAMAQLRAFQFDGVIDLSAYSGEQTRKLLEVLPDVPRLVHTSSGAVYEPQPVLPWPENTPYGPWSLWGTYAVEKLACEHVLREGRSAGLATTVIRLPYVLGPANYADREEFVLNRLLDGATILIPGDGQAVQQFVATRQVGHAMVAALEIPASDGWRAYNVGSPSFASLRGFVQVCAEVANVEPVVRMVGDPSDDKGSVFNPANAIFPFPNVNYVLDLEASRSAGIAPPPVPLSTMIRRALDVLLARPDRRSWSRTAAELIYLGNGA